jgi:phosphoenolpyruvate synthase/pyruvate phosphate dikinase
VGDGQYRAEVARRSATIRQLITSQSMPPTLVEQILAAYSQLAQRLRHLTKDNAPRQ